MDKWDVRFLLLAREVASWSKDPSTRVGAVIVRPNLTVAGVGFNGFPRGMKDDKESYADREIKLSRTIHAEVNAILNTPDTSGCTIYVTHPPCTACALTIIQAGITRVVANPISEDLASRWASSIEKAKSFFMEAGVFYG